MVFVAMASIGLPGLNGFVGEVLSLGGMFRSQICCMQFGTSGVVLGAWYLLTMVQQAFFGPLREPAHGHEPIKRHQFARADGRRADLRIVLVDWRDAAGVDNTIRPDVEPSSLCMTSI